MRMAVIPARGGSKRIPRKNIRDFFGKPIIAWSIEAARDCGLFDHIVVSTDDAEIAEVAKDWGAETPFVRPAELSDDYSGITEVVAHATRWGMELDRPPCAVCLIYSTAPLVQAADLIRGLHALESGDWAYALSVTDFASPIFRSFREHPEGGVEMFFPEHFDKRSQDLPVALHDAAQFCWGKPDSWVAGKRLFERHTVPVPIPRWRVQDIDSEEDWQRAEILHSVIGKELRA